jgi:drug/metabolite transporter (DMT)-like permease
MTAPQSRLPTYGYLLLVGITIFWGTNWPAMKIVLGEMPVWWFRSFCVIFSGVGLLAIAMATGTSIAVPSAERRPLVISAVFNTIGWHIFTGYGVSIMPAGRASIIAFTMPVWAALLGYFILGEPLTKAKITGLALGVAGLAVLVGPDLMVFEHAPVGALFMLLASVSWGIGTILVKRENWTIATVTLAGWQLVVCAVPMTVGAMLIEPFPDLGAMSTRSWVAITYIFLLPLLFGQWAFLRTVRLFPASIASIGTLAVPVVGVYSSALVLGEPVGVREFTALVLICSALFVVMVLPAIRQASPRT